MNFRLWIRLAVVLIAGMLGAPTLLAQGTGPQRVFVEFEPGQKAPVKAALQAAGGLIHFEFDSLSAISVTLPQVAVAGIERNPNVALVEADPPRYPLGETTPYGVPMVQTLDVWVDAQHQSKGAGVIVGLIDSGVYGDHDDLRAARDASRLTGDVTADGCGHGTHVAGTIFAVQNTLGVVGVAPETSVRSVKVFGDDCSWTYASGLINAVQVAINNGAKIISMSLGGTVKSRTEDRAFNQFYNSGVLSIAAAGNAGNTQSSYPASYSSVVSVAAIDQSKAVASFSQKNSQVELAAPGVGVLSTVPFPTASVSDGADSYLANAIEFAATGSASGSIVDGGLATSADGAWAGKVVLVQRGTNSFYEKVMNVQNSGGRAAIIYNNVPGGFSGTLGTGNSSTIPAVSITQEDGQALLTKLPVDASVNSPPAGTTGSGYAYYDGTSMATPHVSAVAALLWSAFPCATNDQVRSALQSGAEDLGAAGRDTSYGFGLVQAKAALDLIADQIVSCDSVSQPPPPSGDTTPPKISNVSSKITNSKNGSFEIDWATDEPATSDVEFQGIGVYSDSNLVTSHKRSFRGTKGITYYYRVRSTDAAGNQATDPADSRWLTHKN